MMMLPIFTHAPAASLDYGSRAYEKNIFAGSQQRALQAAGKTACNSQSAKSMNQHVRPAPLEVAPLELFAHLSCTPVCLCGGDGLHVHGALHLLVCQHSPNHGNGNRARTLPRDPHTYVYVVWCGGEGCAPRRVAPTGSPCMAWPHPQWTGNNGFWGAAAVHACITHHGQYIPA